jgi:hypothetical protein
MSVKIMGLVWDLDNSVIDREEKYVLLAYVDHADHNGYNIFPSIDLICQKTGYKERAAQMITRSLVAKGFLIPDGKGPKGTNKWKYGGGAKNAGVQESGDGGASSTVEGGAPANAPESSKPSSLKPSKSATPRANDFPSNVLYREVTERYPSKANWHDVLKFIDGVSQRLGRAPTKEDLAPFYSAWCGMGWNNNSINWLEYAVKGVMPGKQNGSAPSGMSVAQSWLAKKEQEAQNVRA